MRHGTGQARAESAFSPSRDEKKSIGFVSPAVPPWCPSALGGICRMLVWTCGDGRLYQSAARDLTMMHM
ncbi:hypothetical protein BDP81DRAFT_412390 [Colletotrichum phormii]|uniref:Uncharacterized protein n=1 Tax=Colletotrichum phormii TaxID=359342 RepID=A0AAJ0A572_9PEZI|nr:uncharacterized protein BDP81DRAFT_412390 [Colletotrichum phormii]KAK1655286.1 hypothetical protein BDP81DRAFT_412390 [Colletotrichum phormii]